MAGQLAPLAKIVSTKTKLLTFLLPECTMSSKAILPRSFPYPTPRWGDQVSPLYPRLGQFGNSEIESISLFTARLVCAASELNSGLNRRLCKTGKPIFGNLT